MTESTPPNKEDSPVNEMQRRILVIGAFVALVALLFPPWSFSGGSFGGYRFILSPPRPSAHINSSVLFLELMALGLMVWFLFVATRNVTSKKLGRVGISIIGSFLVLTAFLFAWFVWPKSYTEQSGVRVTRVTGTRYVWTDKRGWVTEEEKKAEDVAEDSQRRTTAKPVLNDLSRMVVERDDGEADHLLIHNPTHWSLPFDGTQLTIEYYRLKSDRRVLLKIAETSVQLAPGMNDLYLYDAPNFVDTEPLLESFKITATSAQAIGGAAQQTTLVPPFSFEHQRLCQTRVQTQNDPEDPYVTTTTSKVVCRKYN